jgi:hypothetical protein
VLQNFIAFKNPSSSAGFEPANLGSNGKHDNHYTAEIDKSEVAAGRYKAKISPTTRHRSACGGGGEEV